MKSTFCTIGLFSFWMGIIIMVFPYIMTLFNRFNKDRVLAWRKYFVIIIACYMPVIVLLFGVGFVVVGTTYDMGDLWKGYYFVYLILITFVKKRTNLQLGLFKFIGLATLYYLSADLLLAKLCYYCNDPYLACMFSPCSP